MPTPRITTEIRLIEKIEKPNYYRLTVNGIEFYTPFDDLMAAKAAAFDEILRAQQEGLVSISWERF